MHVRSRLLTALAVVTAVGALGACGGDDNASSTAPSTSAGSGDHSAMGHAGAASSGAAVDRAFARAMIPHHESAVAMAQIAEERAGSGFVKMLARDIISSQERQIAELKAIDTDLEAQGAEVGDLGVADHAQGRDADLAQLRSAKPFDRAFVTMMIPHHQGAVEMAKAELARGEDARLKTMAEEIIDAQQGEIDAMNDFLAKSGAAAVAPGSGQGGASTGGQNKAHKVPEEK